MEWRNGVGGPKTLRQIANLLDALGEGDAPLWAGAADSALAAFEEQRRRRCTALAHRLSSIASELGVTLRPHDRLN